ncbi:MAG: glycosyltransferase [Treponema sp.]|nr:glycosyltransferase [Treponema sp.]
MNFLYDLSATQPSPQSKFHGGGEYGEVVFFKLLEFREKVNLFFYYDSESYLNPDIFSILDHYKLPLFDIRKKSLPQIIQENSIDRAYSAMLNLNQNWPLGKLEVYTTVHGLRTIEMPFDSIIFDYEKSFKEKIKNALFMTVLKKWYLNKLKVINGRLVTDDRINVITISNHSLASINSFYPETIKKNIPVFASPTFSQLDNYKPVKESLPVEKLSDYGISEKKYFLITSAARWTKNALRAIEAFDSLISDGIANEYNLVVTGVTKADIFSCHIKNKNKIKLLGYVEREELELLNRNAYAFIYPSLNEGFGYPPIDSMSFDVPVMASGTSSIPEVCGEAALYFDPYSKSEIKNRIVQLLNNDIYELYKNACKDQYEYISNKQKEDLNKLLEYLTKEDK